VPARSRTLPALLDALEELYGAPAAPEITDPLEIILYESIAYLANDARRAEAWSAFTRRVGTSPARILAAPRAELTEIARAGILPAERVERVREISSIVIEQFGGDLNSALDERPAEARRLLQKFPSIGAPGAEKILLFSRREAVLALESNGLRVLLRLGYGTEQKSYAASYRSAQSAAMEELEAGFEQLIRAHQLLRRHGQQLCRRMHPRCEVCPLRGECSYARCPEAR